MSAEMILPRMPGTLHQAYTIRKIKQDNHRTRTYTFDRALPGTPGQFVMVWLPGNTEKPFCLAGDTPLQITIVAVGPFTDIVHELKVGDRMWVRGPLGQGYRPYGRRILLAGGGYGAAPLLFLARQVVASGMEADACVGAVTAGEVLLAEDFKALGAHLHTTTDDGSLGEKGLITQPIERLLKDPTTRPDGGVYACGPVKMLEAIDALCARLGVARQLSWEAHMRCGVGLCGSCEIALPVSQNDADRAAWLVCLEGPVSTSV